MIQQFFNREKELSFLNGLYKGPGAQFVVLYGRRRVGKTELALRFARDKPHLYFLSEKMTEARLVSKLKVEMGRFMGDDLFAKATFTDLEELFREFVGRQTKRFVFILDEFPYLIDADDSIISKFQKIWDLYLSKTEIFFILTGSSVGMMESRVLSYKSPLYGRRTGQWKLEPFSFRDTRHFFRHYSADELVQAFGALGGVPLYLSKFDPGASPASNILDKMLSKGQFLYEEAETLFKEEFREPRNYFLILEAISQGSTSFSKIVGFTMLDKTLVSKYLSTLCNLHIVEKVYPVTLRRPKKRDTRYTISDKYLRFWFRFIHPNRSYIEQGKGKELFDRMEFNQYISLVFEDVCQSALVDLNMRGELPTSFMKIGKWWYRENEIDLVALNEKTRQILFAECKWKDNVDPGKILKSLKEKTNWVDWNAKGREEFFAIFAKSFKDKTEEKNLLLFDLTDFERLLKV